MNLYNLPVITEVLETYRHKSNNFTTILEIFNNKNIKTGIFFDLGNVNRILTFYLYCGLLCKTGLKSGS